MHIRLKQQTYLKTRMHSQQSDIGLLAGVHSNNNNNLQAFQLIVLARCSWAW